MENVQNATAIRRQARLLWDLVVDLQDEVATLMTLIDGAARAPQKDLAWVFRPGGEIEKIDLVEYAREVLGNAE